MTTETLKYPAGSVLMLSQGDYSDYGISGLLVTLQECDLPALAKRFVKTRQKQYRSSPKKYAYPSIHGFAAWLIASGYALPVDFNEVHLGSAGTWEPEFGVTE